MKRKAIQLANQTIVVSLPAKWVKQQGIKKGDEIDVEEKGKELIINADKKSFLDVKKIDISLLDPLINRRILGLYINGVDEIQIKFDNPKLIEKIQKEILSSLIGFEIVEQGKDSCIIKSVSEELEEEFDNLLKRIFILVQSMGEEILEALENKKTDLEHVRFIDHNVNKFTSFCLRFLNKKGFKEYSKITSIYSIIQGLEHVGDLYKKIAIEIVENELKLDEKTIKILRDINSQFKEDYHLFYKFEDKKVNDMALSYEEIDKKIKKIPKLLNIPFLLNELNRTIAKELLSNQLTIR